MSEPWKELTAMEEIKELGLNDFQINPYGEVVEEWAWIETDELSCARGQWCCGARHVAWRDGKPIGELAGAVIGPYLDEDYNGYPRGGWRDAYYFASDPRTLFCEDCILELSGEAEPDEFLVCEGESRGIAWSISVVENVGPDKVRGFLPWVCEVGPWHHERELPATVTLGAAQAEVAAWIAQHGCQHEHTYEDAARPGARVFVICEDCGDSWRTDRFDTATGRK